MARSDPDARSGFLILYALDRRAEMVVISTCSWRESQAICSPTSCGLRGPAQPTFYLWVVFPASFKRDSRASNPLEPRLAWAQRAARKGCANHALASPCKVLLLGPRPGRTWGRRT